MAAGIPLPGELFQAGLQGADTLGDQTPVGFELGFARSSQTNAALLPLEMGPASDQARGKVRQLRQLHLELAFEASRPLRKDI